MPRISLLMRLGCLLVLGLLFFMFLPSLMRRPVFDRSNPEEGILLNIVTAANAWRPMTDGPLNDLSQLEDRYLEESSLGASAHGFLTNIYLTIEPRKLEVFGLHGGWIRAVRTESAVDVRRSSKAIRLIVIEGKEGKFYPDWRDEEELAAQLENAGESLPRDGHIALASRQPLSFWLTLVLFYAIPIGALVVLILPPKSRA
jgi:hypothetical protein